MVIFDLDQTLVDTSPVEHFRAARKWQAVMSEVPRLKVYEGVNEMLGELHARGVKLAIVTKSPDMVAKAFINEHNWPIQIVVGYHQVLRRKPDPEALLLAMKLAAAASAETCHVGDRGEDTAASRAAGVVALGAAWGTLDLQALEASAPDKILRSIAELRAHLGTWRS